MGSEIKNFKQECKGVKIEMGLKCTNSNIKNSLNEPNGL